MAEFGQLRRGKGASFYSQVEKEGSSSLMVLSDEMPLKFQSLFSLKCFKSFTGPINFDILLGERSGTVPMYLPEAEGPLFPSCFPWCDRHSHVQLSSNCRAMRPEGAQLHQPPHAAEQPQPAALPEAPEAAPRAEDAAGHLCSTARC